MGRLDKTLCIAIPPEMLPWDNEPEDAEERDSEDEVHFPSKPPEM